jgi:hypothetical protein
MIGTASAIVVFAVLEASSAQPPQRSDTLSDVTAYHQRAREALNHVLATPEFRHLGGGKTLSERFYEWLINLLEPLGRTIRSLPQWVLWLVIIWMILCLLAVVIHLLYVILTAVGVGITPASRGAEGFADASSVFGIRALDFESIVTRARELANQGAWAHAIKYAYLAAILWLDRRGLVMFHPAKSNGDYVRELARVPQRQQVFRQLTDHCEPTVYGGVPATGEHCQRVLVMLEHIQRETAAP